PARPVGARHSCLRRRPGRPAACTARGVEPQGGRDPLLPSEAPTLCRGVRQGGGRAAPGGHPLEDHAAPARPCRRADALAQEPLLPPAALPPAGALLRLALLRAARLPGRQERLPLPLPAGVLVPAGRRREDRGAAAPARGPRTRRRVSKILGL